MKNNWSILVICVFVLFIGLVYVKAEGNEISICVKKNGFVYVIGENFKTEDCNKNDSLLSWNIIGPQGPKGDKGEIGPKGDKGDNGLIIGFVFKKDLPFANGQGSDTDILERVITYNKKIASSTLRFTYEDTFGVKRFGFGGCDWYLYDDGVNIAKPKSIRTSSWDDPDVVPDATTYSLHWILPDLSIGNHFFSIRADNSCSNGYGDADNFLSVEEILN